MSKSSVLAGPSGPASTPQSFLAQAGRWLGLAEDAVLVAMLAAMVIIVDIQVVFRYILNNALIWPEEMSRLLLIWIGMLGSAAATRLNNQIAVLVVVEALPPKLRIVLLSLSDVIVVGLLALLIKESFTAIQATQRMTTAAANVPVPVLFLALVVGGALMMLHTIVNLVSRLRSHRAEVAHPKPTL